MDNRKCTNCKKTKNVDEFNGINAYCINCLEKEREKYWKNRDKNLERKKKYDMEHKEENKARQKEYSQIEVFCSICQCNIKKCRLSRHLKTNRHINKEKLQKEEEKKQKEMEEYLKDDEERIAKLKQIWKTITPKNFKRL